ncbi:uncharacterized protein with PIN domain [Dysgonomonadaceae bacterium PH5-43]|nr:uncharacterized protein with PIN domain [Dysgonomonadaceae bacterium PH5-43]
MYCYNCGNKIDDTCKFCPVCGANQQGSIISSVNTEEVENEEIKVYIKCKHCDEVYFVENQDEWGEESLVYECDNCKQQIEVSFFGYCYCCNEFVGFRHGEVSEILWGFAKGAVKGFLNPGAAIEVIGRFTDNIPNAKAHGECPVCNTKHLKCTGCNCSIGLPIDAEDNQVFKCENCQTKMRQP